MFLGNPNNLAQVHLGCQHHASQPRGTERNMSHFHVSFASCSLLRLDDMIPLIISPSPSLVISTRYRLERGESYIVVSTLCVAAPKKKAKLPLLYQHCAHNNTHYNASNATRVISRRIQRIDWYRTWWYLPPEE